MWIEQPTRRQMLQRMCAGFGMVGLAGMLPKIAAAGGLGPVAHFAPRAKRVIFLFMNGGPSHVDTFDPKPMLEKYDGQPLPGGAILTQRKTGNLMKSPYKFARYGKADTEVSELWPNVGSVSRNSLAIFGLLAGNRTSSGSPPWPVRRAPPMRVR